jgi:predicted nucleic acid-binding protein
LIVVDASVMVAWLINEPHASLSDDVFGLLATETILIPGHWPAEIGNALVVNIRRGRIAPEQLVAIVERLRKLDIELASTAPVDAVSGPLELGTREGLTAYDAAYVLLAQQARATLITVDNEMRQSAQRLRIPILPT